MTPREPTSTKLQLVALATFRFWRDAPESQPSDLAVVVTIVLLFCLHLSTSTMLTLSIDAVHDISHTNSDFEITEAVPPGQRAGHAHLNGLVCAPTDVQYLHLTRGHMLNNRLGL
jgi:hypothetical protein